MVTFDPFYSSTFDPLVSTWGRSGMLSWLQTFPSNTQGDKYRIGTALKNMASDNWFDMVAGFSVEIVQVWKLGSCRGEVCISPPI